MARPQCDTSPCWNLDLVKLFMYALIILFGHSYPLQCIFSFQFFIYYSFTFDFQNIFSPHP
jgi:hypothetical protein